MSRERPIEVAVVGGGCGAITAAFELSRPEHRGKYHVTVYQLGWRLGGKGASGRGPADRIEEHGLHLWLGFYENAFRLLRECYAELGRDPATHRMAHWRDAFVSDPFVGLYEPSESGDWRLWATHFPPGEGTPGDPLDRSNPFTVSSYMQRCATLLVTLLGAVRERRGEAAGADSEGEGAGSWASAEALLGAAGRWLGYGRLATVAALIEGARLVEAMLELWPGGGEGPLLRLLDALGESARRQLEALLSGDLELRRLWQVIDLVLAILRGSIRFGLATDPRGFDAIDDYECREWLRLNGASESSLASPIMRGLYDLALAYEEGDYRRPSLAAGQALRGAVRMFFTYRGALFWKMQAGMGDVVFAPFYEVLKQRGVDFRFFHRLENVRLAEEVAVGEKPYVEALEFDVQAEVRGGGEYRPLVDVRGLPCWPSVPDFDQLEDGERMAREGWDFESHWDRRKVGTRVLRVTEDFDFVVLGVGLGAVPYVCRELVERDARWRSMVEKVKTVATQAFQVWLREDVEALGWPWPPVNLSGFVQPFDTWADMRQLISEESWREPPRAIAYFCSALDAPEPPPRSEAGHPERERERVRRHAVRFLEEHVRHLWPGAERPGGGFRWQLLIDPAEPPGSTAADGDTRTVDGAGPERFASQFWTANVNPSDRYVLCVPGSVVHRISPLDSTYDNLTIAGDWTSCGFNEGCVEAAVMSGRLAAHAISLEPPLEDIVGYDHP